MWTRNKEGVLNWNRYDTFMGEEMINLLLQLLRVNRHGIDVGRWPLWNIPIFKIRVKITPLPFLHVASKWWKEYQLTEDRSLTGVSIPVFLWNPFLFPTCEQSDGCKFQHHSFKGDS